MLINLKNVGKNFISRDMSGIFTNKIDSIFCNLHSGQCFLLTCTCQLLVVIYALLWTVDIKKNKNRRLSFHESYFDKIGKW